MDNAALPGYPPVSANFWESDETLRHVASQSLDDAAKARCEAFGATAATKLEALVRTAHVAENLPAS
ncbi:MAG: hypothetical protein M0D55_04750 [Elusimicrobiota bacterium]|nr:MAG: hypothetical protein M0D55_04750 [Elusimicrobiota bacterium]